MTDDLKIILDRICGSVSIVVIIIVLILGIAMTANCSEYSAGDKFILENGKIIELVARIAIYDDDDECLSMQRKGYLIHCVPEPIAWKWHIIIQERDMNIVGWILEENLSKLRRLNR